MEDTTTTIYRIDSREADPVGRDEYGDIVRYHSSRAAAEAELCGMPGADDYIIRALPVGYELIGQPRIEDQEFEENAWMSAYETIVVCSLRRSDGVNGDVWLIAGVPEYQHGSSDASGSQRGYEEVWVFGDSLDSWCPESFREGVDVDAIVEACREAALTVHRDRIYKGEN